MHVREPVVEGAALELLRDAATPTLPRGRHSLPRDEVVARQRARILAAMVRVVGQRGYHGTRVAHVTECARLSRRTFYDLYDGKEDCFVDAFGVAARTLVAPAERAVAERARSPWVERTTVAVGAFVDAVVEVPDAGRVVIVESLATGAEGLRRRDEALAPLYALLAEAGARRGPRMPSVTGEIVLGGLLHVLFQELTGGDPPRLARRARELVHWTVAPYAAS